MGGWCRGICSWLVMQKKAKSKKRDKKKDKKKKKESKVRKKAAANLSCAFGHNAQWVH